MTDPTLDKVRRCLSKFFDTGSKPVTISRELLDEMLAEVEKETTTTFKAGDVVRIKGLPMLDMSIRVPNGRGSSLVTCVWMADGVLQMGQFDPNQLVRVESGD